MAQKIILIVEKDKALNGIVQEFFAQHGSEYSVMAANSILEAVNVLSQNPVDLILSAHERPEEVDGLKLLAAMRRLDVPVRVVLIAGQHLEEDRNVALSLGCTTYLRRPFSETKLCELMFNMMQPNQGFAGRVVGMKLEDIIQMFCYRKDSTLLTIFGPTGQGVVYVDDGGIIHAECDSVDGVEAFYEILGWESGEFLSQLSFDVPQRTVFMDWQSLLMEGMRQRDEIRHALGPTVEIDTEGSRLTDSGNGRALQTIGAESGVAAQAGLKRIMIVDDSRFIRKIVQEIVQSDPGLMVAGYATNGQEALAKIDELKPDLILLDWDMPVMKGSTTLMHIMIRSPCPVVILSGFVGGMGANPFDLLCLGGVDFLRKPQNNWRMDGRADDLVRRIKAACDIKFERIRRVKIPPAMAHQSTEGPRRAPVRFLSVFASSTGGCADLIRIIPSVPVDLPCAVVVLHDMQQEAIGAFVDYLDRRSRIPVRPLESGVPLSEGVCYVHPALVPLELTKEAGMISAKIIPDLPVSRVLDHFLISACRVMGKNILAMLLSGGPELGVEGLRAVKQAEGITLVQDPMSSMDPRLSEAAIKEGIVDYRCSADGLAEAFLKLVR